MAKRSPSIGQEPPRRQTAKAKRRLQRQTSASSPKTKPRPQTRSQKPSPFCLQLPNSLENWITCFNKLLFLLEAQITNLPSPISFELPDHQKQLIPPKKRFQIIRSFYASLYSYRHKYPFLSNLTIPPHKRSLPTPQLQTLSDTTLYILTRLYQLRLTPLPNLDLQAPVSLFQLLEFIHLISNTVPLATLDQLLTAYKQSLDYQFLNLSTNPNLTQQNFILNIFIQPPQTSPTSPTQVLPDQKIINLYTPPPSITQTASLFQLSHSLTQNLTQTFSAHIKNYHKLSDSDRSSLNLAIQSLIQSALTQTLSSYFTYNHPFDPDAFAFDISKKITQQLSQSPIKQFLDPQKHPLLKLRSRLDIDEPEKLHQILHQVAHQTIQNLSNQNPNLSNHLQQTATTITQSLPNKPQLQSTLTQFIKHQILSQLSPPPPSPDQPPPAPSQSPEPDTLNQAAQQIANYITFIHPVHSDLVPSLKNRAFAHHIAQQVSSQLNLPETQVLQLINTTAHTFSPFVKRLTPTPFLLPPTTSPLHRLLLRHVLLAHFDTIITQGQDPYTIYLALTQSLDTLKDRFDFLVQGAPFMGIATRPPLTPDHPHYQLLSSQIKQVSQLTPQQLQQYYDQLPFHLKLYVRWQKFKNKIQTKYLDRLDALKALPGYQLSLKIEGFKSALKQTLDKPIKARWGHTQFYQQVLSPIFHPAAQKLAQPFSFTKALFTYTGSKIKNYLINTRPGGWSRQQFRNTKAFWLRNRRRLRDWLNRHPKTKTVVTWTRKIPKGIKKLSHYLGRAADFVFDHTDPHKLAFKLAKFTGKQLNKALIWILSKISLKLGTRVAALLSGVGTVLTVLLILKDVFDLIKRYWKEIVGTIGVLFYLLLKFILSHLVQFGFAAAGWLLTGGSLWGAALGYTVGETLVKLYKAATATAGGLGNLLASVGEFITNLTSSLGAGIAAFATSFAAWVGGGVAALSAISFIAITAALLPNNPALAPATTNQFATLTKNADLSNLSAFYQPNPKHPFPSLTNQVALQHQTITYKVKIQASQPITITQFSDTLTLLTKNQKTPKTKNLITSTTLTTDTGQTIKLPYNLNPNTPLVIAYTLTLDPSYQNTQIINQAGIKFTTNNRTYEVGDSFVILIGDAPMAGCSTIATTAKNLAQQLGVCQGGTPPTNAPDCFCPAQNQPQLGLFTDSFHCGPTNTFKYINTVAGDANNYIQCTEFVNDVFAQTPTVLKSVYDLCGVTTLGNAADWGKNAQSACSQIFDFFKNGDLNNPPQPGDILVFASGSNPFGHVGVVTLSTALPGSNNGTLQMASANINTPLIRLYQAPDSYGLWSSFSPGLPLLGWLRYKFCSVSP